MDETTPNGGSGAPHEIDQSQLEQSAPAQSPVDQKPPAPEPGDAADVWKRPGDDSPPPGDDSPRPAWTRPVLIAVAAVVVVAGAAVGAIAFALRGSSDVITHMVPANASVYVSVSLDPSLGQKLALRNLLKKFPATDTTGELNSRLDSFFDKGIAETGLSFTKDVRPWLGSQLGGFVQVHGSDADGAFLLASKDDTKAQASLAKIKRSLTGQGDTFAVEQHGGIAVTVGTPPSGDTKDVFAIVSHTVVLASSAEVANQVIDTAQGTKDSIDAGAEYAKVLGALPKDKLAFVYVDAGALIKEFESDIDPSVLNVPGGLSGLDAYKGAGLSLAASSDGIAADVMFDIDRSKLTADQRQALAVAPHANTVLPFMPRSSYGVLAIEGLKPQVRRYLDTLVKQDPSIQETLDKYGLGGTSGVIEHLTGDAGVTVGVADAPGAPGVAVLAGTNDEAGMKRFLDTVASDLGPELSGSGWVTQEYQGVTISYAAGSSDSLGFSPAYAVTNGMAVVALSPDEIKAVIDAKAGTNVTDSANYRATVLNGLPSPTSLLYLDIEGVTSVIRGELPPDPGSSFDTEVAPNLKHLKALGMTSSGSAERESVRFFLLVR